MQLLRKHNNTVRAVSSSTNKQLRVAGIAQEDFKTYVTANNKPLSR